MRGPFYDREEQEFTCESLDTRGDRSIDGEECGECEGVEEPVGEVSPTPVATALYGAPLELPFYHSRK